MDLLDNIRMGFEFALTFENLFYCALGVTLGTLLGVIPGVGVLVSISLLFPLTFHIPPESAVIMLAGIYYGTTYGGSTTSILINTPGTPANAVACIEGHAMAKSGRAGVALFMTTIASFFGGTIGILLLILLAPLIAEHVGLLRPPDYASIMLLGLVAAATAGTGAALKGLAMVSMGILLGTVGLDIFSGIPRLTFGSMYLYDGFGILVVAMGLFGVSEVIASIRTVVPAGFDRKKVTFLSLLPSRDDWRRSWLPMLRGAGIGSFFGTLPGTGGTIASFMSYAVEKGVSRRSSAFGTGVIEGLVGPESANNASDQTAFIPTLTLGIPGTASMAIILSVLMLHGIIAGPKLVTEEPELFWGLVASFWIGNVLLLVLNIPFIGLWVRLLSIPYHVMFPSILAFVCIGIYSVGQNAAEVLMIAGFGVLGYLMREFGYPSAPLLLGFVLGPLFEEQFVRSLILSGGDFAVFMTRPISASFLLATLFVLVLRLKKTLSERATSI